MIDIQKLFDDWFSRADVRAAHGQNFVKYIDRQVREYLLARKASESEGKA
jgi:hypothetical protein